ncbi:MAG: serine/threonine protein kinase [Lysobacter sp.]|nr:MAG: serine/threonine protein kinase [Lysobacter sp.]
MSDATSTGLYARMDLTPGTLLAGRFRIESLIGVGGMGVVYRALDEALGVPVAIKLLRPELANRPDAFERFRQELLLARQVSSPHVVRIHDIARHEFDDGDARWLISMDLIEGEPLDQRLDRGPLEPDDAIRITRQLALGLQAAHASEVVHRDLKPANVLIDAAGNAYITDFGVARSLAGSARGATSNIVGTPDYLSPEQARGDPVGPRSDLYALGLILHEMLTGERAFPAATAAEALAQRLVRSPPLLSDLRPELPKWIARLAERLLRPQPSHRLPDAAAVVTAIDRRELPRDPRRLPTRGIIALVATALLAVVAVGWWWSVRAPDAPAGAPAPSQPLDRLLLMPLEAPALPAAERVGIEMHLRQALAGLDRPALVDTDRSLQALRQLDMAGPPSLDAMRRAGAASRVLDIRLVQVGSQWQVAARLADGTRMQDLPGVAQPTAAAALGHWLASPKVRVTLGLDGTPYLRLPASSVLAAQGAAEIARRDGRYDVALATLRQATAKARDDPTGWLQLADVAQAVGEEDTALGAVETAQRSLGAGGDRLLRQLRATRALLEGDAADAATQWRALLTKSPSDTWAELQLARALGAAGDFNAAGTTLRRLADRDAQDARAWFELGKLSILKGEARPAVDDYLLRALVLFKRSRNTYGEAEAVNALGVGYGRLGQTADAEEQYRRAVTLRRAIGNRRGVATSLRNLANLLGQRGAFDEAAAALDEARRLHIELGDRSGLAALDDERGLLFEERGDYRAALEAFRLALQGWERAGDPHGVAQALNDIGFAHYQLGAYDDAQTYWQRAAEAYRALDDQTGVIRTSQNLALLDAARGRWDEARQRQQAALAQAQRRQMAEEAAVGYRNLAELSLARGDIGKALSEADRAMALFNERDDRRGSIDARLLRIDALIDANATSPAATELEALRKDLARASTEQRAIAGRLAAELAVARGDTPGALAALRIAVPLAANSGVRQLQLELELMRLRLSQRDPAALDEPTAMLGHALLRLHWIEAALADPGIARQPARAVSLYREATNHLRGLSSPLAARLHALGATAYRHMGDAAAADEAEREAEHARSTLRASLSAAARDNSAPRAPGTKP